MSEHLKGLLYTGCARRCQFAVWMKKPLGTDRGDINRPVPCYAEHFDLRIGFGDVHQAARPEANVFEAFAVRLDGQVVIHSGG